MERIHTLIGHVGIFYDVDPYYEFGLIGILHGMDELDILAHSMIVLYIYSNATRRENELIWNGFIL